MPGPGGEGSEKPIDDLESKIGSVDEADDSAVGGLLEDRRGCMGLSPRMDGRL